MILHEFFVYSDLIIQSVYMVQISINYPFLFSSIPSIPSLISTILSDFIDVNDLITSTIALFVIIDPIGIIPLFISLTRNKSKKERKTVTSNAIITTGILLLVFAIAGTQILTIFGITISSFMIAGGILLFIVAIELMTRGEWTYSIPRSIRMNKNESTNISDMSDSTSQDTKSNYQGESGVVPLAFPLLAGPGAITAVIISYQANGLVTSIVSIAIVLGITYVIFNIADLINKVLGQRGSMIVTRVFAVIVAAIAIQYIIQGVEGTVTSFMQVES
jgi:multiple antibiotic resistance protein